MGARRSDENGAVGSEKFGLFAWEFFVPVRDPLRRNVVAGKLGIQQGQPQLLTGRKNRREMEETRVSIWGKIDHCRWNTNMLVVSLLHVGCIHKELVVLILPIVGRRTPLYVAI
ncbi:hypothetical protein Adt_17469 [Abeliophyllum distichum]|uniref:Uncharacterized protein n=1 Tax=Abeliophyllum distichum TaxID=126358 RepID=A0ABD1TGW8_9LAMI